MVPLLTICMLRMSCIVLAVPMTSSACTLLNPFWCHQWWLNGNDVMTECYATAAEQPKENGAMSFKAFYNFMTGIRRMRCVREEMYESFRAFDRDGDGYIKWVKNRLETFMGQANQAYCKQTPFYVFSQKQGGFRTSITKAIPIIPYVNLWTNKCWKPTTALFIHPGLHAQKKKLSKIVTDFCNLWDVELFEPTWQSKGDKRVTW